MNKSILKLFTISTIVFLLSAAATAYVIYDQKKEGESLWSFGENIESWDRLNQASASLENENETGSDA